MTLCAVWYAESFCPPQQKVKDLLEGSLHPVHHGYLLCACVLEFYWGYKNKQGQGFFFFLIPQKDKSGWPLQLLFPFLQELSIGITELNSLISTEQAEVSHTHPSWQGSLSKQGVCTGTSYTSDPSSLQTCKSSEEQEHCRLTCWSWGTPGWGVTNQVCVFSGAPKFSPRDPTFHLQHRLMKVTPLHHLGAMQTSPQLTPGVLNLLKAEFCCAAGRRGLSPSSL